MFNNIFIPKLDDITMVIYVLKVVCISITSYYTISKITNYKIISNGKSLILAIIFCIFISIICGSINNISSSFNSVITLIFLLSLSISKFTKFNMGYAVLITVISLSINYILFFIAVIIVFTPNELISINNDYISLFFIISVYIFLLYLFFRNKRIKNGFIFLNKHVSDQLLSLFILNVGISILFLNIIVANFDKLFTANVFFAFIISSIFMFITIQKSIQLYYKQKLLIQDLEETKKELEEKKEEIKKLEQENLSFSKKSHSIAHKQKALEHKLNEILLLKTELGSETNIKEKIDKISEEISKNKPQVELSKTNIEEIDDMLKYMQSECIKNNIDFDLQIIGNIYQMTNNYISKEKLEILLADHVKNAIIAINYSDNINKSILVRLGKIDGFYSLYIYDSGIEFEINTLLNLGVKPSTTHKSSGGTGMGFMNTFDTVREYKASFILEEYGKPSKDDYTKAIMIKFDKKEDFKIISYRKEEIENEAKGKKLNFILNKRNNI